MHASRHRPGLRDRPQPLDVEPRIYHGRRPRAVPQHVTHLVERRARIHQLGRKAMTQQVRSHIGSNRLLAGRVAAKFAPVSALLMGAFVLVLYFLSYRLTPEPDLVGIDTFLSTTRGWAVVLDLFGVAVAGGMFVVPLYAFLTTTVPKSETARTVAANNIVNSGAMVVATLILAGLIFVGVSVAETLFLVAVASVIAAWLGQKLHRACD